jgi:hypothetical protein
LHQDKYKIWHELSFVCKNIIDAKNLAVKNLVKNHFLKFELATGS